MSILSQFLTAGSKDKIQTFTSSSTFTVPENVFSIFVTMCAGGGGRSANNVNGYVYGGGGGGGYYVNYPISVTPGDVLTITIGAGGTSRWTDSGNNNYGSATIGGISKVALNAVDLLVAYGGSASTSAYDGSRTGTNTFIGGAGGYPNGSGGGAAAGGTGGCGLAKGTSLIGGGHISTGPADSWGMGPMKGYSTESAQDFIPGYGAGEQYGGYVQPSNYAAGTVRAEPGIVIIKWIGA